MLAVSPLRNPNPCERAGDAGATDLPDADDFSVEFDFDFTELFAGFEDGEALPGLDPAEVMLTFSSPEGEAEAVTVTGGSGGAASNDGGEHDLVEMEEMVLVEDVEAGEGEKMEEASKKTASATELSAPERERGRRPSAGHGKGSNGKKKMKVDWTPELHRQFVQAVEQLGVEKAVPSRILELMGIDCLTRHNVASHLQKYRSHRKHMMVREAEATSWSQRRQVYAVTPAMTGNIRGPAREINPWMGPTMGFPQAFRPLHVWGHPTMDQSLIHMWPSKHLFPIRPAPSPPWVGPHPQFQPTPHPPYASPWNSHFSRDALSQGTPYFAQQMPAMRFPAPPVAGVPPPPMYRPGEPLPSATPTTPALPISQTGWLFQHDAHPSKESIDAAIGEVLAQPWLPVPLGLKPPSLESVMAELQKQGISAVPPCT